MSLYTSPRTFFNDSDSSPPNSPLPKNLPTFHLSPAPGQTAERSEHRRWNSLARPKPHPLPFSYEYIFEEGKLAGLAEYHPEQDFLHYSSSRGSSRTNSRNPSRRTSFEYSARSSIDTRYSHDSEHSHGPIPSPRTTDKIKRALSLTRTRSQRTSSGEQSRIPSPAAVPQGMGLEFLTSALPAEPPKTPTQAPLPFESPRPAPSPDKTPKRPEPITVPTFSSASVLLPFESPRAAPSPPQKQASTLNKPLPSLGTAHHAEFKRMSSRRRDSKNNDLGVTQPRKLPISTESKGKYFQGSKRPTFINPALERAYSEPMMSGALQPEEGIARPPVRRKTSKFIEHLDDKPIQIEVEPEKKDILAVPFIPPFDFELPTPPKQSELPQVAWSEIKPTYIVRRSQTVARRDPNYTHPEWPSVMFPPQSKAENMLTTRTVPRFALGPRTQPLPNHIVRKRSASNMKSSESTTPASTMNLKRSTSMRTRPSAMWADVRMAEVKPTLMSPVVASGHARMISC